VGALDQAREVGEHEALVIDRDRTEHGHDPEMLPVAVIDQCVERRLGPADHSTTAAAVTAVRPAARDVLLAPEADAAIAAVAALDVDLGLIEEAHRASVLQSNQKGEWCPIPLANRLERLKAPGYSAAGSPAITET
jgi:hypothetical protein